MVVEDVGDRRVAVLSQRGLHSEPVRCVGYEFEDVVVDIERADLLVPNGSNLARLRHRAVNRISRHAGILSPVGPGFSRRPVPEGCDLFFANFQFASDLYSLSSVPGWRRADRKVCVIEELWARDVSRYRPQLSLLRSFDRIFVECLGSVEVVEEATGVPCSYLPPPVDALRFCPLPSAPPRVVDVCHLGRRTPATHGPLVEATERGGLFYVFDTVRPAETWDWREHRVYLASLMKRSRYVVVNPAKMNSPAETGGQQEIGFRFFEGVAGGAVLLGTPPANPMFGQLFDWKDAVVPIDSGGVVATIDRLEHQPDRIAEARRANVVGALRRHDALYRWETVLGSVGLELGPAGRARGARLGEAAEMAEAADMAIDPVRTLGSPDLSGGEDDRRTDGQVTLTL